MQHPLRQLGYPEKGILYAILVAATIIGMKYVIEVRLPDGGRPPYLFLVWNTFLAWIPAGLAVLLDLASLMRRSVLKSAMVLFIGLLWLFFYPNAAYMVTDLLHPFARFPISGAGRFWSDMLFWDHLYTVLFTALLGLALGTVSLASVHGLVRRWLGSAAGWIFAVSVLLLSSFGIYLGRFIRFNSWDIWHRPIYILREMAVYFMDPGHLRHALAFCKWMFLLTAFSYAVAYFLGAFRLRRLSGPVTEQK
ncbi:hypothetical protein J25TS5_35710 [Paenibacillus faecis]|uniref:DUF1361 domain-containing protein n=1 Tax=Paenibacillus faecis TaxID=862114 RepID=UPI001B085FEE|nr:DUF1361 domain-containing protein [Paenibacillus faecis]GIO86639.1 hypothetical protein J25TS5_35710 [Paenibacillus faecis]